MDIMKLVQWITDFLTRERNGHAESALTLSVFLEHPNNIFCHREVSRLAASHLSPNMHPGTLSAPRPSLSQQSCFWQAQVDLIKAQAD